MKNNCLDACPVVDRLDAQIQEYNSRQETDKGQHIMAVKTELLNSTANNGPIISRTLLGRKCVACCVTGNQNR